MENNDGQGYGESGRLSCRNLGACYSPFLSAQLSQPQSCSLFSCELQTTALVLRKQCGPLPIDSNVLCACRPSLISELWLCPFSLATPRPVLLGFSLSSVLTLICAWPLSETSLLQPWVSGTSPSGLPRFLLPPPSLRVRVCVWDWGGEGLASILGLKNYNWFPTIREMQIETIKYHSHLPA